MTKIRPFSFTCPNCGQTITSSSQPAQKDGMVSDRTTYLDGTLIKPSTADTLIFCQACRYTDTAVRKKIPDSLKQLIKSPEYQRIFSSLDSNDLSMLIAAETVCENESRLNDQLMLQKALWHHLPESPLKHDYAAKYLRTFDRFAADPDSEFTPEELLEHAEFLRCLGRFEEAAAFLQETDTSVDALGYFDVPADGSQKGFEKQIQDEYQEYQKKFSLIKQLVDEESSEPYIAAGN